MAILQAKVFTMDGRICHRRWVEKGELYGDRYNR